MKPLRIFLPVSFLATALLACEGKVLDVGAANLQVEPPEPSVEQPIEKTENKELIGRPAGIWVMTRQDGQFGLPEDDVPPMELEITEDGGVFRYECVRLSAEPATEACEPAMTTDCLPGTIVAERDRWRIDLPALNFTIPEIGETVLLEDGTLMVRYINPTYSAGYFKRVAGAGAVGGCAR